MRFLLTHLLTFILFLAISQPSWKFSHLTTDDGLSSGTANCVFKDTKGYIWIGTTDGLNRYNGYSVEIFKAEQGNPNSLSGNNISSMAEDSQGNIWIGTRNNGISIFNWETEQFRQIKSGGPEGLTVGAVRDILFINENEILMAVQGGGLVRYNIEKEKATAYMSNEEQSSSISNNNVFSIIPAQPGYYWVGTHSGGVDLFNLKKGTFEQYIYNPDFNVTESNRKPLLQDRAGKIWIGTDGDGLFCYNPKSKTFEKYTQQNGLSSNIVSTLYESEEGNIYIGTDGGGINVYSPSPKRFSYIQSSLFDEESLSSDAVYEIYKDTDGVIWVSTFRGGVNIYSSFRYKFHMYEQLPGDANSLSFNSVIALEESSDGYIWIGTDGGGLDRLNPRTGQFRNYSNRPGDPTSISSNVAIAIREDRQGYIWVGTYAGGLNRLDPRTGRFRQFLPDVNDPTTINSRNVWDIVEDSDGNIWLGLLDGGLDLYRPETDDFIHFTADGTLGALSSNLVITMLEDTKGNIWVGTENAGLNQFDRKKRSFKTYRSNSEDASSLASESIRCLHEDRKGKLWIGTSDGMNIIDLRTLKVDTSIVTELLPSRVINSIEEDRAGNLWISTNKGLSKYNPQDQTIQNFTQSDGLQGNDFNYSTSLTAKDGRMYFGGIKGLNDFVPEQVKTSSIKPKIIISSFKVFDKSIQELTDKQGNQLFPEPLHYLKKVELTHDQNVIEIGFAALDYTSPMSNKYRYKLEGFDQDWVNVDATKRSANYTNLDAGSYTFLVKGTNSDGVWSNDLISLELIIHTPWWATIWFRTLVFIIVAGSIITIYRWRVQSIKAQRGELERRVEEATQQMAEQNKELQEQQNNLEAAIVETNFVIQEAVESGNFTARIELENKIGQWRDLGESINKLFDSIITPFNAINDVVNAMAESDLSSRYYGEAKGDLKRITDNLNLALDNLSTLLRDIVGQTTLIGQSSEDMSVSSEDMNVSTNEIATSISEMSQGAQNQLNRIDTASGILESILRFSREVGMQAESINMAAERGVSLSDEGKALISKMNESMKKMLAISHQTNKSILLLSEKSSEISSVLNVMKEMAGQTNMLALNAAIEAAKAGDSGRGFSVVAEQIRQLAEDSSRSANEIEQMIDEVQSAISGTTELIAEMNEDVQGSVDISDKASDSFNQLASSNSETLGLSEKIVGASNEQNESVREVVELMENVVVIAEETAAGTEEAASSSQELSSGMTEYSNRIKGVTNIVRELQEKVGNFILNQETEPEHNPDPE